MAISFRIPDASDGSQRTMFYQYDRNQRIYIDGATVSSDGTQVLIPEAVLVSAKGLEYASQTLTGVDTDGNVYAAIPDVMLEEGTKLYVYAYDTVPTSNRQEVIATASYQVKQRPAIESITPSEDNWKDINKYISEVRQASSSVSSIKTTLEEIEDDVSEYSSSAEAARDNARDWATKTTTVENGLESAKTYSEIARDWATKTSGIVEGTDYSAKKISQDLHAYVGSENDAITENSVYGIINKKKQDIIDHVGINPADDDETSKETIDRYVDETVEPSLNSYAMGNDNDSLKNQLNSHVNDNSTGLKKQLDEYEETLEVVLNKVATGPNLDFNGGIAKRVKDDIDTYEVQKEQQLNDFTTGTSSDKMFGKLREETTRLEGVVNQYASSDQVKGIVNAFAETSVTNYVNTNAVSTLNSHVGSPTDAASTTGSLMARLNSQSQSIASQLDSKRADYDHLEKYVGVTYDVGNIWDEEWELGKYSYDDGQKTDSNNSIRSKNMIGISPSAKYYITFATFNAHYHNKYFYDASGKFLSYDGSDSCFFTSPDDARYMSIAINADYGTTYNHDISIKKVHGTEPTTWEKTYSSWGNCLGDIDDRLSSVEDLSAREGREKSELLKTIDSQSHSIANQQYRIKNLEAITKGDIYTETTSTTTSGTLSLPSTYPLAPYASIDKILGKTVVVDGALESSSIAKLKSVGRNIWDVESYTYVNQGTYSAIKQSDGSYNISSTAPETNVTFTINVSANKKYYISTGTVTNVSGTSSVNARLCSVREQNGNVLCSNIAIDSEASDKYFIPTTDTILVDLSVTGGYGAATVNCYPQITQSETPTVYKAYSSHIVNLPSIELKQGDIFNPDTGMKTVTWGDIDLGSRDWGYGGSSGGYSVFYSPNNTTQKANTSNILCTRYSNASHEGAMSDMSVTVIGGDGNNIYIRDSRYTSVGSASDPNSFLGSIQGLKLMVELRQYPDPTKVAEPIDSFIEVEAGGTVSVVSTGAQAEAQITYQTDLSTGGNA